MAPLVIRGTSPALVTLIHDILRDLLDLLLGQLVGGARHRALTVGHDVHVGLEGIKGVHATAVTVCTRRILGKTSTDDPSIGLYEIMTNKYWVV